MESKILIKSMAFIKRNSSCILTITASAGVIASTVLAAKATPKALDAAKDAYFRKPEDEGELTKFETFKAMAPAYIPTVIIAIGTISCIIEANALNQRQRKALASAYGMLSASYNEYRRKAKEIFGEDADDKIKTAVIKDHYISYTSGFQTCGKELDYKPSGEELLFYEEFRNEYFQLTMEEVIEAEYHLNRNFALKGYVSLNEFYDFLGLEHTIEGEVLGWSMDMEYIWIDFNHQKVTMDDGLEVYIVQYPIDPDTLYLESQKEL